MEKIRVGCEIPWTCIFCWCKNFLNWTDNWYRFVGMTDEGSFLLKTYRYPKFHYSRYHEILYNVYMYYKTSCGEWNYYLCKESHFCFLSCWNVLDNHLHAQKTNIPVPVTEASPDATQKVLFRLVHVFIFGSQWTITKGTGFQCILFS